MKTAVDCLKTLAQYNRHIEPRDQERLREVHPELVFHNLNGWQALPPKKTSEGACRRRAILARHGINFGSDEPSVPRRLAGADDLLDAAACALAAEHVLSGRGCRLPPEPTRDRRGLRMEIWY